MALAIDLTVTKHDEDVSTLTTPSFSTNYANELLLAFFMADSGLDMDTVTGGGLTWVKIDNPSSGAGMAYAWRAFAPTSLTNITVSGSITGGVAVSAFCSITAITGIDTSGTNGSGAIGATNRNTQVAATPSSSLTTTRNNSWVWGCVSDQSNNDTPTAGSNQTLITTDIDENNGVSHWAQRQITTTPTSGTVVTINDTAPVNIAFGMVIVEVLPSTNTNIPHMGLTNVG